MCELQERGVQRALVDRELLAADLLDAPRDRVAMQGAHRVQRLEDHEIERAVEDVRPDRHVLGAYCSQLLVVNTCPPGRRMRAHMAQTRRSFLRTTGLASVGVGALRGAAFAQ